MAEVFAACAVAIAIVMTLAWIVAAVIDDLSIVDPVWALGIVIATRTAVVVGDAPAERALPILLLVAIWGFRLGGYLIWRKVREPGEDRRYTTMRERWPAPRFTSLFWVFWLQGALMWIVLLPVMLAMADDTPDRFLPVATFGMILWLIGMVFETLADLQLARFKADPANEGKVLDTGVWRYARHPNYFGEACIWWGVFLVCLEVSSAWAGVAGPLLMTVLLLRVSGVAMTERTITSRRPGYADYQRRTNAFLPGPPKD